MSRLSLAVLVVVAAVAVACGSGAASEGPESSVGSQKPALTVGKLFPLTIRGARFRARERVTVTVSGERPLTRRVTATRAGSFVVSFRTRLPRCGTVLVRARGTQGSRASHEVPRPDCRLP